MADLISMMSAAAGLGGEYKISRSLRFNSADSAYLNRTFGSAGDRKTFTISMWVKRASLPASYMRLLSGSGGNFHFRFTNAYQLSTNFQSGGTNYVLTTTQVFRDASAWYHLVAAYDTTQATSSNRIKFYVNGEQITAFGTANYPPQNAESEINDATAHYLFSYSGSSEFFDGYATEIHFINGSALDPTSFGEFNTDTGVWQPIKYTGTYGTNGFYLNFSDNTSTTTLGDDFSGNNNDWTTNNFSVTAGAGNDSLVDSPTRYGTDTGAGGEVRGNYCTLNPIDNQGLTLANGNLDASYASAAFKTSRATISMASGKWYFEATANQTWNYGEFGVMPTSSVLPSSGYIGASGVNGYAYQTNGYLYNNDVATNSGISTVSSGDIMMCAVDIDAGKIWFGKNGTWFNSGAPASGTNAAYTTLSGAYSPAVSIYSGSSGLTVNFGQRPFAYTAPSGFKALCTTNLPTPTIADGGEYFNPVLWTGTGTTQNITGVGFQPDFVWMKSRTNAYNNWLFDAVRGTGKLLASNTTDAESSANPNILSSFNADGFTTDSFASTQSFVAWNWKANGSGVSNTDGTITSTVSANTDSGFSIVTWTSNGNGSATVGHGLGVAPKVVIYKNRTAVSDWYFFTTIFGSSSNFLRLNTTAALGTSSNSITSTTFNNWFGNTDNLVAYCFAEVAGYSAFGSYTGNGSSDGPFVYTGFRPRWVMVKRTDTANSWYIQDTSRPEYNVSQNWLEANASDAEGTSSLIAFDFLSNGFKRRGVGAGVNASGGTYIYAAFAESPLKFALGR